MAADGMTTVDVDGGGDLTKPLMGGEDEEQGAPSAPSPLDDILAGADREKFQGQIDGLGKKLGIDPTKSDLGAIMIKIKSMPPGERDAITADAAKLVSSLPRDKLLAYAVNMAPDQADMIRDAGSAMSEEDIRNLLKTTIENTNPDGSINKDAVMKAVGKTVAKNEAGNLKHWITHGFTGVRVLGFIGGVGLLVAAVLGIIIDTIVMFAGQKCFEGGEGMIKIVMDFYLACFGLLIALIEARTLTLLKGVRAYIKHEAHFLDRGLGRGVTYIFVGSVAIGSWDLEGLLKIIFGLWLMIIGIWNVVSAIHLNAKLKEQLALKDPEIMEAWERTTGGSMEALSLDPAKKPNFAQFLKETGHPVDDAMAKALGAAEDTNGDGKIGLHEYLDFLHEAQNDDPTKWVLGHAAKNVIQKGHDTPAATASPAAADGDDGTGGVGQLGPSSTAAAAADNDSSSAALSSISTSDVDAGDASGSPDDAKKDQ